MGLFKKRHEENNHYNGKNTHTDTVKTAEKNKLNDARIKILGSGCTKCNQLEANTLEALKQLGMNANVEHVTDFAQIAAYGIITTPALIVDNKVIAVGKVLKTDAIIEYLQKVI